MKSFILVVDSGVGGLTTLYALRQQFPNNYIYFADYKNHPYGQRSPNLLLKTTLRNIAMIESKYNISGVILACNTLSVVCGNSLRKLLPQKPIIGTKPCVKSALKSGCKHILVLSTPNTAKFCKIPSNKKEAQIVFLPLATLASEIEENLSDLNLLVPRLREYLIRYIGWVDGVVLGCTHYVYLKKIIPKILDENVKIFENTINTCKLCAKLFRKQAKNEITFISNSEKGREHIKKAWILLKEGICAE